MVYIGDQWTFSDMPKPYQPLALANEFICFDRDGGISHMKLQKLVYFAHGWWLTGEEGSILDEDPEVWRHGPVFNSMYKVLSGFGAARISAPIPSLFGERPPRVDENDVRAFELIRFIWGRYGRMSAFELSDMTHSRGSAWQVMAERYNYNVPTHLKIDRELIRSEFVRIRNEEAHLR